MFQIKKLYVISKTIVFNCEIKNLLIFFHKVLFCNQNKIWGFILLIITSYYKVCLTKRKKKEKNLNIINRYY